MSRNRIDQEEHIEGDRDGTSDFIFARIGSSVPLKRENSKFELSKLPGRPLAVSEKHGAFFLVIDGGFIVVKTVDAIGLAKALKEIEEGSRNEEDAASLCVQEKSILDARIGDVHILAVSSDSTTLAAVVGQEVQFYSVSSLLQKEQDVAFVCSIGGSGNIKDFAWRKDGKNSFILLSDRGTLYGGEMKDDLKVIMEGVEAADWSMKGSSLAVIKNSILSILSSGFEEKLSTSLSFHSWFGDSDSNITVKVDSVKWAGNDSIVIGCVQVNDDNEEIDYLVQVITTNPPGFDETSSSATVVYFSDLFHGIVDDIVPYGSGPYLLMNYLENWDLAFIANRKNTDDHVVLMAWSGDDVKMPICLEFEQDKFIPRIELQENHDENLLVGMDIERVSIQEKLQFVFNLEEKVLSPRCILLCLTCEGKLILFHVARLSETAVSMPESKSLAEDNYSSVLPTSGESVPSNIVFKAEQNLPSDGKLNGNIRKGPDLNIVPESLAFGALSSSSAPKETRFSTSVMEKLDLIPKSSFKYGVSSTPELSLKGHDASSLQGDRTFETSATFGISQVVSESKEIVQTLSKSLPNISSRLQSVGKAGILDSGAIKSSIFKSAGSAFGNSQGALESQEKSAALGFPSEFQRPQESGLSLSSDRTKELLRPDVGSHTAKESFIPGKFEISNAQDGIDHRAYTVPRSKESAGKTQKQFYSVDDMTKELDDLLEDIEREGGFRDACTASHSSSVIFLEEGIGELSEKLRKCKAKVEEQLKDIQQLQDRRMQVTARQVYIEELVKQASNGRYWDLWNSQKLGPEFEIKQQRISKLNHALVNELIELERHFNTIELQNHGESGTSPKVRRASRETFVSSRQNFSVHSLYNTVNLQISAAEQLSTSLSNHMGLLKISSPPSKQHSVKKELFESIGLEYDSDSFQSPQRRKDVNDLTRTTAGASKSMEPESTRRRRDSLDRSWTKFDPPKTTVKRTPQGRNNFVIEDSTLQVPQIPLQLTTSGFQARVDEISKDDQRKTPSPFVKRQPSSPFKWRMDIPQASSASVESSVIVSPSTFQERPLDKQSAVTTVAQITPKVTPTSIKASQFNDSGSTMSGPSPNFLDRATTPDSSFPPVEKTFSSSSSIFPSKTAANKFLSWGTAATVASFSGNLLPAASPSAPTFGRLSTVGSSSSGPSQISLFSGTSVTLPTPSPPQSKPEVSASLLPPVQTPESIPKPQVSTFTLPATPKSTSAEVLPVTQKSTPTELVPKPHASIFTLPATPKSTSAEVLPMTQKSTPTETSAAVSSAAQTSPQPSTFSLPAVSPPKSTAPEVLPLTQESKPAEVVPKPQPTTLVPVKPLQSEKEAADTAITEEDEMEEEAPEVNAMLSFGGFGLGQPSSANRPNPFGASAGAPAFSLATPQGELFRPASFSLPVNQPVQPSQPLTSGGFGGGGGGISSGFGRPAQIRPAQQALGSVLGSFGQSRQLGFAGQTTGMAPAAAPATGGGGGFAAAAGSGRGFAAAATSGGGFAAAGGGGFAAMSTRPSGFAAIAASSGQVSGGFGAFGSTQAGSTPPPSFLTQMRK
ncbi:nuclear pore complex protein [Wolffia australiana]